MTPQVRENEHRAIAALNTAQLQSVADFVDPTPLEIEAPANTDDAPEHQRQSLLVARRKRRTRRQGRL
ncbi:MAG: hypothetical protein AAFX03_07100 [Pseudomonadota bacterium]